MIIIQTDRLLLREFNPEDAAFTLELLNTPTWLQYIGDRKVRTLEDAHNYIINHFMASYQKYGFGFYLVEKIDDHQPIGMCGIVKRDFMEDVDIGFAFLPAYEGKGYGFEAASAFMKYAENTLNLERITAVTLPENINSRKLIEKIGLRFEKLIPWPLTNQELMLFANNIGEK